jgi:glycerol uptake facilitator-like aquaporin
MAQRLAGGTVAVALLANTLATSGVLVAIILAFGQISGAHFNPAVSIADALGGGLAWRAVPSYIPAQVVGAISGVALANAMFSEPLLFASHHGRHGWAQGLGKFVATFGLIAIIRSSLSAAM